MRAFFAALFLLLALPAWAAAPAVDGAVGGTAVTSGTTVSSAALTTTNASAPAPGMACAFIQIANVAAISDFSTVSSISGGGLTWTYVPGSRQQYQFFTSIWNDTELWCSNGFTANLSAVTVTATLNQTSHCAAIAAFGVSGANTTHPFDGVPGLAEKGTARLIAGISRFKANDLLLSFGTDIGATTAHTVPTGFTSLQHTSSGACSSNLNINSAYQQVTSASSAPESFPWQANYSVAGSGLALAITADTNDVCEAVTGGYICRNNGDFVVAHTIARVGAMGPGSSGALNQIGAGAGGAYCYDDLISGVFTPGGTLTITVGGTNFGGQGPNSSVVYSATPYVSAEGGATPAAGTGGVSATAGSTGTCVKGGNGGNTNGGGGGGGGSKGAGANGATAASGQGGGGGGGGGGGSAGSAPSGNNGGAGGNNYAATGGGTGGLIGTPNGGNGSAGGGGGGTYNNGASPIAGAGGAGAECASSYGGGGGGAGTSGGGSPVAGAGGFYGAGSGGAYPNSVDDQAAGAQGIVFIATTMTDVCDGAVISTSTSGSMGLRGVGH